MITAAEARTIAYKEMEKMDTDRVLEDIFESIKKAAGLGEMYIVYFDEDITPDAKQILYQKGFSIIGSGRYMITIWDGAEWKNKWINTADGYCVITWHEFGFGIKHTNY